MKNYKKIFGSFDIQTNKNLKNYSTIKMGGVARGIIKVKSLKELLQVLLLCKKNKIKYKILGNGSNVVFSDQGYNGLIIHLEGDFLKIKKTGNKILVGAGVFLSKLNQFLLQNEYCGMEWSFGIPGTVGGAIFMNAGAFGGEVKDCILKVYVLQNGELKIINNKDCNFGYRSSIFKKNNEFIILYGLFQLKKGKKQEILQKQKIFIQKRIASQPIQSPSAGSVFLRQENVIPAKLIDEAGLKGFKYKGVKISEKHAGFIVNYNNGKTKDLKKLIDIITKKIYNEYKVKLQTQIEFVKK